MEQVEAASWASRWTKAASASYSLAQLQAGESVTEVVLYHASGCHLCERARRVVGGLRAELGFSLTEIDITDDPELEARYREWLPVVEVDGERAFTYYVHEDAFRRKVATQPPGAKTP
ncbi:MAG: glutaredoxin family protein [Actinobacteria bacterium]|nr:glutaredoxin family protein [Actinomycetota bacterium]